MAAKKTPKFFKAFIPFLSSHHMKIPNAFIEFLATPLPEKIIIRACTGKVWPMAMIETGNSVFFARGWEKFVRDNNLKMGDILVFWYNGSRFFDVRIFGDSECEEVRYGVLVEEIEDSKHHGGSGDDDDENYSVEYPEGEESTDDVEYIGTEEPEDWKDLERCVPKKKGLFHNTGDHAYFSVEQHMDDPMNPFLVTRKKHRSRGFLFVRSHVIKDYNLKLPRVISFSDSRGRLDAEVVNWGDGRVWIKNWGRICRRNNVSNNDILICEFLQGKDKFAHVIKVHIIRR